ncbi:cytochrome b5-like heme/steroid binding domain-containing protein, putative, partial [Eimeria maxima]
MHGGSSPAAAHEAAEAEAAATDGATNAYVDPSAPATVSGTVAEFGTIPILRASEDGGSSNGSSSNDSNHSSGLNHIGDVGVLEGSPVPLSLPFTPLKPQNSLQSLLQTHATRIQQQQQEQQQAIGASNTVVPMRTAGRMGGEGLKSAAAEMLLLLLSVAVSPKLRMSDACAASETAARVSVSNQNRFRELMAANKPREDTLRLITPEE